MKKFTIPTILLLLISTSIFAQQFKQSLETIDVLNYKLTIAVNDTTNTINASMAISLKFIKNSPQFNLNLIQKDSTGSGMFVNYVLQNKDTVIFNHANNNLLINTKNIQKDSVFTYTINYEGIPKDGLIIGENMYGDRTFFGDNWPNRAQNWFPCVDHPSDKATVEYLITAPNYYQVIANGFLVEETNISNKLKLYYYKNTVPLPTKVMVIGIAKFAVQNIGEVSNIPISTWVYPQTKEQGFYDFEIAKNVIQFFIENIGEYPFSKLANVQSKTRYGGMENAGNIFYFEKSVTGKRDHEALIAHEIAHQWFGNSATEIDWPHLWLSEGFATYFTNLYFLKTKGISVFKKRLENDRQTVINFNSQQKTPVVDYKTTNLIKLLNANSYQKGSWVLHMLRIKLGDELFWSGIKEYYKTYKYKNASTNDFKNIMTQVSGLNLDAFFKQWLGLPDIPTLKTNWIFSNNKVQLIIEQTQKNIFNFPLEIEFQYTDGTNELKTINVNNAYAPYTLDAAKEVKNVVFDPNINLLFQLKND